MYIYLYLLVLYCNVCLEREQQQTHPLNENEYFRDHPLRQYHLHIVHISPVSHPVTITDVKNKTKKYNKIQTQKGYHEHIFILHGHTVCTFSGKSPLSSHKMTLKQQINGQKR